MRRPLPVRRSHDATRRGDQPDRPWAPRRSPATVRTDRVTQGNSADHRSEYAPGVSDGACRCRSASRSALSPAPRTCRDDEPEDPMLKYSHPMLALIWSTGHHDLRAGDPPAHHHTRLDHRGWDRRDRGSGEPDAAGSGTGVVVSFFPGARWVDPQFRGDGPGSMASDALLRRLLGGRNRSAARSGDDRNSSRTGRTSTRCGRRACRTAPLTFRGGTRPDGPPRPCPPPRTRCSTWNSGRRGYECRRPRGRRTTEEGEVGLDVSLLPSG